jgi:hypothetical protein
MMVHRCVVVVGLMCLGQGAGAFVMPPMHRPGLSDGCLGLERPQALVYHDSPVARSCAHLTTHSRTSLVVAHASDTLSSYGVGDGFESQAGEGEWVKVSEGVTAELAEDCSVEDAAGIAYILTSLMETCSSSKKRLPRSAADVLQALLSHPAGSQAFWTTYLTEPDLDKAVQAPFEPSLVRSIERFPELNIGVLSSCLAMSATEEALFVEEGDDLMVESAKASKDRTLALIKYISRQPDAKRQSHGLNWMLDLIDYEALDMARDTVELRQSEDQKRAAEGSPKEISSLVVSQYQA